MFFNTRMDRSRRERKQPAHISALQKLKEAKSKGKSRLDQLELESRKDVYDLMTEADYAQMVAQRRDANADFVVDDDGDHGYYDDGEEEDWEATEREARRHQLSIKKFGRTQLQPSKKIKPTQRIDRAFLGNIVAPGREKAMADVEADEALDDAMVGLDDLANFSTTGQVPVQSKSGGLKMALWGHAGDINSEQVWKEQLREDSTGISGVVHNVRVKSENKMENILMGTAAKASNKANMGSVGTPIDYRDLHKKRGGAALGASKTGANPHDIREAYGDSDWFAISKNDQAGFSHVEPDAAEDFKPEDLSSAGAVRVYWFDAFEVRDYKSQQHGNVFLFGKLQLPNGGTASCCVVVENLERNIFVLPRKFCVSNPSDPKSVTDELVQLPAVYAEVKDLLTKSCNVKRFKAKPVERNYCFSREQELYNLDGKPKADEDMKSLADPALGVPDKGNYLKVVYPARDRQLPRGIRGRTFSSIFGTNSSALELLLLKRDLMGPCWVDIKDAIPVERMHAKSWCKFEFRITNPKNISVVQDAPLPPRFSVMSLSIQTVLSPKTHRNEVVMVSGIIHKSVSIEGATDDRKSVDHFSVVRALDGRSLPFDLKSAIKQKNGKMSVMPNERALLSWLTTKIHKTDCDVVSGHDMHGFGLEVLLRRMHACKIPLWAKLGRLKMNKMPMTGRSGNVGSGGMLLIDTGCLSGRLFVDTLVSAKELLRETNYTLNHLAVSQLKTKHKDVDLSLVPQFFNSTNDLLFLQKHNENEAWLSLSLFFKLEVLPLTKVLTGLCGNLWARSLRSARAERIEYLLLHEFHRLKFISPEKTTSSQRKELEAKKAEARGEREMTAAQKKRRKPQYSGGLVLEPKRGFYDKFVLLLDFNSLYPSIVREFNLCFTSVKHWTVARGELAPLPPDDSQAGILPKVINRLLQRRKAVKNLIRSEQNPAKKTQLDIRQKALKLVANSMYGCLGFSSSRFYCEPIAALITSQGRDILQRTVEQANSLGGGQVIYGDTDSIMVDTNELDLKRVMEIGKQIKQAVNKKYKILEIEMDGIFKNMLLLRKKKYAALVLVERPDGTYGVKKEMKGLDLVRRDWSLLSKAAGERVLDHIMDTSKSREDIVEALHAYLIKLKNDVLEDKIDPSQYVITKGLTKNPREYADAKGQPHVQVALRMIKRGKAVRSGTFIPYVVCKGEEKSIANRAFHPDELATNPELVIDKQWYLSNQILPPIARLISPLEETDAGRIAHCLGLDPRKFQNFGGGADITMEGDDGLLATAQDDAERFKDSERFSVCCGYCKVAFEFPGVYNMKEVYTAEKDVAAKAASASLKKEQGGAAVEANARVIAPSGFSCPTPECRGIFATVEDENRLFAKLSNQLQLKCRQHLKHYYKNWYRCSDSSCNHRTIQVCVRDSCPQRGCAGQLIKEFSAHELYTQLAFYSTLFDVSRANDKLDAENKRRETTPNNFQPRVQGALPVPHEQLLRRLHDKQQRMLKSSSYHFVDLAQVFSTLHVA